MAITSVYPEKLGIFEDPAELGLYYDVSRFLPGSLAVQQTLDHYSVAPPIYSPAAMELAVAIGTAQRAAGVEDVQHEGLAQQVAERAGTYYIARQGGTREQESIVAYGFTEDEPDAPPQQFYIVNELSSVDGDACDGDVCMRRRRLATSAILHCMMRTLPEDATVLFPASEHGDRARHAEYLSTVGVLAMPDASAVYGKPRPISLARVATIRDHLAQNYDLTWPK